MFSTVSQNNHVPIPVKRNTQAHSGTGLPYLFYALYGYAKFKDQFFLPENSQKGMPRVLSKENKFRHIVLFSGDRKCGSRLWVELLF